MYLQILKQSDRSNQMGAGHSLGGSRFVFVLAGLSTNQTLDLAQLQNCPHTFADNFAIILPLWIW